MQLKLNFFCSFLFLCQNKLCEEYSFNSALHTVYNKASSYLDCCCRKPQKQILSFEQLEPCPLDFLPSFVSVMLGSSIEVSLC